MLSPVFLTSFSQIEDLEKYKCLKKCQEGIPPYKYKSSLRAQMPSDSNSKVLSTTEDPTGSVAGLNGMCQGKEYAEASTGGNPNLAFENPEKSHLGNWKGRW